MRTICPICGREINVSESSGNICCSRACATKRFEKLRVAAKAEAESGPRTCSKCGETKPITEFFVDRQKATGYRPDCKKCNGARSIKWNRENKHRHKGYCIKHNYGISMVDYNEMVFSQNGECAICKKKPNQEGAKINRVLHIDHCHSTGTVRGLLCGACNRALGLFRDDKKTIENALNYLSK